MPLGVNSPVCCKCESKHSDIWHKNNGGSPICSQCHSEKISATVRASDSAAINQVKTEPAEIKCLEKEIPGSGIVDADEINHEEGNEDFRMKTNDSMPGTRSGNMAASTRGGKGAAKRSRGRNKKIGTLTKASFYKGRGRRSLYKKQPSKAVNLPSTTITTTHLFHQDMYYQIGDIVSALDEDGGIYYAQIRGLLQDQYCEKSAVLTWLIPTQSSPPPEEGFDPLTYIIGPEEELPRKLDYLEFVMHAPSEYYKLDDNIKVSSEKEAGYIWTSLGAVRRTIHS